MVVLLGALAAVEARPQPVAVEAAADGTVPLAAVGAAAESLLVSDPTICLSHRFIDPDALTLTVGRVPLVAGRDFDLDARDGCFELRDPRRWFGATLVARYTFFPFELKSTYLRRTPVVATSLPPDSVVTVERSESEAPEAGGGSLRIRGYKTFSVRIGSNRDATLNQALDLDVAGEIADGVELRALLSDRDLPLQPEGNTETLNELDKVMLEVRTPTLSATLGDYDIAAYGGDFLTYSKRLSGLKAEGDIGPRGFVLAAAVSRGEFTSLELQGSEGKQGPYVLTDPSGNDAITVIAGSEAVWLDGVRLVRGQNQDYTIDYSRGEVTFTTLRPITADSRITVDFEYSSQAYERNFYVGGGRSSFLDGKLDLNVSLVSESDDDASPLGELSDEERRLIESAGDSTRVVTQSGGVFVGAARGDYFAIELQSGLVRYQYAGKNRGDHAVRFIEVGEGVGDYQDSTTTSGEPAYRYVGLGNGGYQPGRTIAAPQAHRLADIAAAYEVGERLAVDAEFAVSGLDLNTLSSIDDFNNGGTASKLRFDWAAVGSRQGRGVSLRAGYRDVGTTFAPIGRIRPADYAYGWNASTGAFDGGEVARDLGLELRPAHGFVVGGDLADTRSRTYDGTRRRVHTRFDRRLRGRLIVERTDGTEADAELGGAAVVGESERSRAFELAELSTRFGLFEPAVRFDREERVERRDDGWRTGAVYERLDASGAFGLWNGGRFVIGAVGRVDRSLATGTPWTDSRRAVEQRYQLEVPRWRNLSITGSYTRRTTDILATGDRQIADLVKVDLASSDMNGGLETEVHYDVTTTDVSDRERELVFVGEGQGVYDEFGRFVGTGGDYDLRAVAAAGSNLRTHLRLNARAEFRPRRAWGDREALGGWQRLLNWTGYETTLFVDELSRLNLASPRLFFDPANYQRQGSTFDGRFRLRQDVDILEGARAMAARVRYERADELDNRTGGVVEDEGDESVALRLRTSPRRSLSLEWTGTAGRRFSEERATDFGTGSRLDLRTRQQEFEVTLRPGRAWRILGSVLRRLERDRPTGAESTRLEFGPGVTVNGRRIRTDFRLRFSDETRTGAFPPFYSFTTPGKTTDYDLVVDYRATRYVTLTGSVDGIGRPNQEFVHSARLELRASF